MPKTPLFLSLSLTLALVACAGPESSPTLSVLGDDDAPVERGFLRHHTQLTFPEQFAKAGEAYFSPDATWIIFQAVPAPPEGEEASPHYLMYVARLVRENGRITGLEKPICLSEPGSANTCGWFHPTLPGVVLFGSTIVEPKIDEAPGYSRDRNRYTWQFPNEMNVVSRTVEAIVRDRVDDPDQVGVLLARPDVERAVPIFERDGYCAEASWSTDARTILFTGVDPATGNGDVYVYIVATGETRPLVQAPGYDGGPFYSPDGRYICYRSDRRGDSLLQLFVSELEFDEDGLPARTRAEHALTDNEHVNWAPYWHPGGAYLIYATSEVGHYNYEVFAVPFDRGAPDASQPKTRVTDASGFDGLPAFSRDGKLMMWTAQRGDDAANRGRPSSQLWIAEVVAERPPGLGAEAP